MTSKEAIPLHRVFISLLTSSLNAPRQPLRRGRNACLTAGSICAGLVCASATQCLLDDMRSHMKCHLVSLVLETAAVPSNAG